MKLWTLVIIGLTVVIALRSRITVDERTVWTGPFFKEPAPAREMQYPREK